MITNQHNDGGCFKMTVTYVKEKDYNINMDESKYIMYGDDELELWNHYISVRHMFYYVEEIKIQDDSK